MTTIVATEPADTLTRTVAVGGELHIDGQRVCPWCLEDHGSQWCQCNPTVETAVSVSRRAGQ